MLASDASLVVTRVLTRRPLASITDVPATTLTHSLDELLENCDIVFESSGDPIHATIVVERALAMGKRVVTMNAEFHVTTGSFFHGRGYLTEAEGDQPGAMALLKRDAEEMAFRPLAYVNIKGFLDPNPSRESMEHWSSRQGLSLVETTSFTDGTKLQIEQVLCANGLGGTLIRDGLLGRTVTDIAETDELVAEARERGRPVSDFVIAPGAPPGVFVLADHDVRASLPYYGPYEKLFTRDRTTYVLLRPYHLCALEVAKGIRAARDGAPPLLTNGELPRASAAALAKRDLAAGTQIDHAIGGFDVRGHAVIAADHPNHVPIGLLRGARLRHRVEAGQQISFDDVDLPESRALEIWRILRASIISRRAEEIAAALQSSSRPDVEPALPE